MRVFIDTNVWLSGRFRSGLCADLLETLVRLGVPTLLDDRVLNEFERIARVKLKVDEPLLTRTLGFFHQYANVVPAASRPAKGAPDPDDAWSIASALNAGADWFVTGDRALLQRGGIEKLEIIDPRTAYQRLLGLN